MLRFSFPSLLLALVAGAPVAAAPPKFGDVQPILAAKCLSCHGAKQKGGQLDLRTRDAMLKGGNTGPAIEPGAAEKSLLIELIKFNEMPPRKSNQPRVTPEELRKLRAWIDAGASDEK